MGVRDGFLSHITNFEFHKMEYRYLTLFTLLQFGLFSCNSNMDDETRGDTDIAEISVSVDEAYIGTTISTVTGEVIVNGGHNDIPALFNDNVQTFVVNDGENVYLMARIPIDNNSQVVVDAHSTALALVTMYPMFSPIDKEGYQEIISMITSSEKYPALYEEVKKSIDLKRNIYDEGNEDLLKALSNLIEDLCTYSEDVIYGDTLVVISNNLTTSRAAYESQSLNPAYVDANISGKSLTLRTVGLTPTYYGTVSNAKGETKKLAIKARADFGGLDLFIKTISNWKYGEPMRYTFNVEGEHHFNFSRMTPSATADFYLRLANCLLASLGLTFDQDAVKEIGNTISRAMINVGSGVNDREIDPMAWIGIAYEAILYQLKTGSFYGLDVSDSFITSAKFLAGSLNWYNKIKGVGNAAVRVGYALAAPETISFCLCNYENKITTCSTADIEIVCGDNQTGYANRKLFEPLGVRVKSYNENGIPEYPNTYRRIKFEVTKGDGSVTSDLVTVDSDNLAWVDWILGEKGEQEVRAVAIDIITEKEISDPVYFSASIADAEVTVRLDWSRHSGNTDLDLHVIDPFGEEINYTHMTSASGGYLDHDDIYGPGPEHIHWNSAPQGIYKVYVHYYPNENEDKSIVSYTVSVTANNTVYKPVTGSIAYDQMLPIGQFTVGSNSRSVTQIYQPYEIDKSRLPKKQKK